MTTLTTPPAEDLHTTENSPHAPRTGPTRPARRRLIHVLLVAALAWSAVMVLRNRLDEPAQAEGPAPGFILETFAGEELSLDDLRGQGVVLNFWASWCGPCRAEAHLLEAAARQNAPAGIVFVGINYQDTHSGALDYVAEFDISYANGPDHNNEIARSYGVRAIPDTIFIDPAGQIQGRILGPVPDAATLENHLDRIRP